MPFDAASMPRRSVSLLAALVAAVLLVLVVQVVPAHASAASAPIISRDVAMEDEVDASGYSTEVTYKDIKSVDLYTLSSYAGFYNENWVYPHEFKPEDYSVYVSCYRIPSFYAEIESFRVEGGTDFVLTLKVPAPEGEQPKSFDVLWAREYRGSFKKLERPVVNDNTILSSLAKVDGYDESRSAAYVNAYKLAPFASFEDIVKSGNKFPEGSSLATKTVAESWPVHSQLGMRASLRSGQDAGVSRAVVCFSDGTSQTLDVTHIGTASLVASYVSSDLGILYQPDFFVLDNSVSGVAIEKVASFIRSKTWDSYFKPFYNGSGASFHRTLRDHFDRDMHDNAEEVAANLLTNIAWWCPTLPSSKMWSEIVTRSLEAGPGIALFGLPGECRAFDLLFVYTYYERFYSFDIGGDPSVGARKDANVFLTLAFRGDVIKPGLSLASMCSDVEYALMYTFSSVDKTSSMCFWALLGKRTGFSDVPSFVQAVVARTTGYADPADWFADYMSSRYFYKEFEPVGIEGVDSSGLVWRGWDQAKRFPDYLLCWLTLDDGSQYMASTCGLLATGASSSYFAEPDLDADREWFEKAMEDKAFGHMAKYGPTAACIVGEDRVNSVCLVSVDRKWSKKEGTPYLEREGLWEKTLTEDSYFKGFMDTTGLYNSSSAGAAAMTVNQSPQYKRLYFFYGALECGWGIWSHEIAHAVDNDWFLQGGSRRANNTEDYTDGLLTQGFGQYSYTMNLTNDYELSADVSTNLTRGRIASVEDLNDYYGKMYDALDLLDYAALKAFLELDKDEQNAVASQARYDGQNGNSPLDSGATATILSSRKAVLDAYDGTAATAPMNLSAFNDGTEKFASVEEVYDNQLFLLPGIADEGSVVWLWDNYVTTDLKGVWWHPVHCNANRPDSRSFKLEMYRMLGDYGYSGFANFGTTAPNGDLGKLKDISGYDSFKAQQLAKWRSIEENANSLEYVDFDSLVSKFKAALEADASAGDRNLSQMTDLRTRMYYMMKRVTNDFAYGIYDDHAPVTYIHDLDELRAVKDNPYGNYELACDIDASSFEGSEDQAIVDGVFYGRFDGAGHSIYARDRRLPCLFGGTKNAYVKDVTLKGGIVGRLSPSDLNSESENVRYDLYTQKIYTVDDFARMADGYEGVSKFVLMDDLDFSGWTPAADGGSVVPGLFCGHGDDSLKELDGNGHRITGLRGASLFEKVYRANIHDLVIEGCSNMQEPASADGVALVAKHSGASRFADICFKGATLHGKSNIGCVSGNDGFMDGNGNTSKRTRGSRFERIQVTDATIQNGLSYVNSACYAGFVTGRALNSDFVDIYVQGSLVTRGTAAGGVVGAITQSSRLDRCVSNVDIRRAKSSRADYKNGCVLGDIESIGASAAYGATLVSNCFGLGDPAGNPDIACGRLAWNAPSADGATGKFVNCFENASVQHGTSLVGVGGISWAKTGDSIQAEQISDPLTCEVVDLRGNKDLFVGLGFDEGVWSFEPTISSGYPMLKATEVCSGVVFETNGGVWADGVEVPEQYVEGVGLMLPGSDAIGLGGHVFMGWYENIECSGNAVLSVTPSDRGVKRFWAKWKPLKYKVVLHANGGALGGVSDSFEYEAGTGAALPETDAISREGHTFHGWFDNEECSGSAMGSVSPTDYGDKEFWAKWVPNVYKVSLDFDGGSPALGATDVSEYEYGMGAVLPVAERAGYDFCGWYEEGSFDDSPVGAIGPGSTGDRAFRAKWEPRTYSVAYHLGGPSDVEAASEDGIGGNGDVGGVGDAWGAEGAVGGSADAGSGSNWAASAESAMGADGADADVPGGSESAGSSGGAVGEEAAGIESGGGAQAGYSGSTGSGPRFADGVDVSAFASYKTGQTLLLPVASDLVWESHVFTGWHESADLSGTPVLEIRAGVFGDKEFYAGWVEIADDEYPIDYILNGGAFVDEMSVVRGYKFGNGDVALPGAAGVTRPGHEFLGWFENPECAGDPVSAIGDGTSGPKTFYAGWRASDPPSPPDVDPDPPVGPDPPTEDSRPQIVSLGIKGFEGQSCEWNEAGYAKIEIPRDRMPKTASDFNIVVPDGFCIDSIVKRERAVFQMMVRAASLVRNDSGGEVAGFAGDADLSGLADEAYVPDFARIQSDIWDITVSKVSDPSQFKVFTLEIVPQDYTPPDSDDGPANDSGSGSGDDEQNAGAGIGSGEGGGSGQGTDGFNDGGQSAGGGQEPDGGNGGGTGQNGANGPNDGTAPAPTGGSYGGLVNTGDMAVVPLAVISALASVSALILFFFRRRLA